MMTCWGTSSKKADVFRNFYGHVIVNNDIAAQTVECDDVPEHAAPDNIIVGSHVWVEDRVLAWIDGEVTRINGQEVHIKCTNGKAHFTSSQSRRSSRFVDVASASRFVDVASSPMLPILSSLLKFSHLASSFARYFWTAVQFRQMP
ncbi:hypothetical protein LWI29_025433 [Acer saccharum]|uniref:Myosin N-terminal SH3-like domain-containing protein n=1 Tax=Acer saccharum TaxID=4024 RepID=A0AA39SX07_ACESA|nr:hypothetical protein LWI29_025433 [Acer saccharum]